MKCSVLINNYNYAQYVRKAVDSVLGQTMLPDEIVIVDDGSVDGSTRLLCDTYGANPRVKIVARENRGQLAAMNLGFMNSCGDILFFLDSDDEYDPCYLESALALYRDHPSCDFLICGRKETGVSDTTVLRYRNDVSLGFSVISALYGEHWEGGPTSTLSARRWVLEAFMPLDLEPHWRIRADDCLVRGASLAGAKKYYLARPLVRYRIHNANHYHGRDFDADYQYRYKLRTRQLISHLARKTCTDGPNVMRMMKGELNSSCPEVIRDKFRLYFKLICRADRGFAWKIAKLKLLVRNAFLSGSPVHVAGRG